MRSHESPNIRKCRCQNCFLCCYTAIRKYRMYCRSYSLLYQACKVILTLFVTQVDCERNFSKLRYYKTLHLIGNAAFECNRVYNFTNNKRVYKRFYNLPTSPMIFKLRYVKNCLRNQLSEDRLDSLLLARRVVTHFEPYDHRPTSKNERRNAKTVALQIVFDNVCLLILNNLF